VETPLGSTDEVFSAFGVRGEGPSLEALAVSVIDLRGSDNSTVSVYRFAGGEWERIDRRVEPMAAFRQSDILWIDHRAVIVFGGIHGLVWDAGSITSFTLQSPIPLIEPNLSDLVMREGFGVVMATNDGFLYRMASGPTDWLPIREAILGNGIDAVHPVFEGFIFGGPDGTTNQFYPGSVQCTSERLVMSDVERIVQLGEDILVTGGNPDRSFPNSLTWLSARD
jgi:hypothetical protein